MSNSEDSSNAKNPNFEQALGRLERIVERLEDGDVGLEIALEQYEQGVRLLQQCYGLLQRAERRIELLSRVDAQGNATTTPFDDTATANPEPLAAAKSPSRGPQRAKTPASQRPDAPANSGMDESPGLF